MQSKVTRYRKVTAAPHIIHCPHKCAERKVGARSSLNRAPALTGSNQIASRTGFLAAFDFAAGNNLLELATNQSTVHSATITI